jgi:hypothetical protein
MADKRYLVKFKASTGLGIQVFIAASAEIQDDHLVLLDSEGKLAASSCSRLLRAGLSPTCESKANRQDLLRNGSL